MHKLRNFFKIKGRLHAYSTYKLKSILMKVLGVF